MPTSNMIADRKNPIGGFFGDVVGGLQEGLFRIGSDILPNWVNRELTEQSEDQLARETYLQEAAPRRVDSTLESGRDVPIDWSLLNIGKISGGTILIVGGLFLAAIFLFKKAM